MFKRQLVLVAIDRATDVERTMEVALSAAKAREADIHVIQAVSHSAVHGDDRLGRWAFEPHDTHGVSIGAQLASILRSADDDGVRVQSVTLRGEPEHVIPAYAQLHQATMLVVARDYGSSRFWRSARVVDEVARRSPIPLLVVPKRQRREREEPGLRRIRHTRRLFNRFRCRAENRCGPFSPLRSARDACARAEGRAPAHGLQWQ